MKHKQVILLMLLVALLIACNGADAEWKSFTSTTGNFSLSAPAIMNESSSITETALGKIESHTFTLDRGSASYAVAYVDYPVPGITRANPDGALQGDLLRTLEQSEATLLWKRDIAPNFAFGVEFEATISGIDQEANEDKLYGRLYLLDARLYRLLVVAPKDEKETVKPDKFLTSFRWLQPDGELNGSAK